MPSATFRFDSLRHQYWDLATGAQLPSITQMLRETGWTSDQWYTEDSRERGTAVHRLCMDYDLGAITDLDAMKGADPPVPFLAYLLAHVKAVTALQPEVLAIEEPIVHPLFHFGGRPDRIVKIHGRVCILELKSGPPEPAHRIQTALQCILAALTVELPAEMIGRYALYLKKNGTFRLDEHRHPGDFHDAQKVIRQCCNGS